MKPEAFLPDPHPETSVFRVVSLSDWAVWKLGRRYVAPSGRPIYARGEVSVDDVRRVGLRIEPVEPPPRHASIGSWPKDKPTRKLLALEQAAVAVLRVNPRPDN